MRIRPFISIKDYFLKKYGVPVYKISLDGGFTCPVRDGTKGTNGCLYCDENGSGTGAWKNGLSISEQMRQGMEFYRQRRAAQKFMAYFQAFSNTYAELEKLKKIYDEALAFENVVGLSVGTRPDLSDAKVIHLLADYLDRFEVWLELGLQSAHDETLKKINRGHTVADFQKALEAAHQKNIKVCVHVILGLPDETKEMMLETAAYLKKNKIDGIKIHPLMVKKNTALGPLYQNGQIKILTLDEYADLATDFLIELGTQVIVERITGEDYSGQLLAPEFCLKKGVVLRKIEEVLRGKIDNLPADFFSQKC